MGQQVVGQQHGLSPLHVGVARQIGVTSLARPVEEHLLDRDDCPGHLDKARFGEQPQVRGHLVVAAATSVQAAPDVSGYFRDSPLDGCVDVLVARLENERALGDLFLDAARGRLATPRLLPRIAALSAEGPDVSPAASYVVRCEAPVKREAFSEGRELF